MYSTLVIWEIKEDVMPKFLQLLLVVGIALLLVGAVGTVTFYVTQWFITITNFSTYHWSVWITFCIYLVYRFIRFVGEAYKELYQ